MYLMIDNYDSFVYNLKAYLQELGRDILVRRSDELTLDDIQAMQPQGIILSPGPKRPWDAQLCVDTVRRFGGKVPLLGCAWVTRYWATAPGPWWKRVPAPCMARSPGSATTAPVCSPVCPGSSM